MGFRIDIPLKLVNVRRLKMNKSYNCKIMSITKATSKPIFFCWGQFSWEQFPRGHFFRGEFSGGNFPGFYFPGEQFSGGNLLWGNFSFLSGAFFRTPLIQPSMTTTKPSISCFVFFGGLSLKLKYC